MASTTGFATWAGLSLSPCCMKALKELGFVTMTPVQSATIPYFMRNKDVAVEAVTGSGKTLAFVIPVVEILLQRSQPWSKTETGALLVSPTRELASQIAAVIRAFLPAELSLALLIGGQPKTNDLQLLSKQGAHVVVGTPGRLVALLGCSDCTLSSAVRALEVLVLDEADRLLEMGFQESITTILSYLPKQRRTGLFSATLSQDVQGLVHAGLRNPVTISVRDKLHREDPTPKSLKNFYLVSPAEEQLPQLLAILHQFKDQKVIVFFATCASVTYFSTLIKRFTSSLIVLVSHGRISKKRQKVFDTFAGLKKGVLLCTDVMARGVDFPSVDWVLQFDPPSSAKTFVHRCGRTARMGSQGKALVLLLPSEVAYVEFLQLNQQVTLLPLPSPALPVSDIIPLARAAASKEREIYEKGMRAFVSFVRFYHKHECKLLFRPKELDLVALATGFALLHLPKMPELKGRDTAGFTPYPVDPASIPYKNHSRERMRLTQLQQRGSAKQPFKHHPSKAKRSAASTRSHKRKREYLSETDLEELASEARLLKKFKAGKISKSELEAKLDTD